jgi:ElaB/YqjD/DUF883 family membrane-anchored ribosome-binding protein
MKTHEVNIGKLVSDLKVVVQDAEGLLKATAGEVSENARIARDKLTTALESARASCDELEQRAIAKAQEADRLVRQHPYETIGVAFGVGILLGIALGRK